MFKYEVNCIFLVDNRYCKFKFINIELLLEEVNTLFFNQWYKMISIKLIYVQI